LHDKKLENNLTLLTVIGVLYIVITLALLGNVMLALLLMRFRRRGRENDRFLRTILDSLPFPVHVKDVERGFIYRYFNKKSVDDFGPGLLKTTADLVVKENADQIEKVDEEVYDTGVQYNGQEELLFFDGRHCRTLVQKSVIQFEGRRQLLIVRWDIEEFLNLQEQLKAANHRNEVILNNVDAGLVYITPDFVVQWENMSRFSDHPQAKLYIPGQICYITRHGANEPCSHCLMLKAMETKLIQHRKMVIDDNEVIEFTVTPVLDQQNEIEGYVTRVDNVTERERIHSELEQAKLKAERSDKLKSTFLANMSHEIRTPLNAIVGFSDMMRYIDSEEERNEYHTIVESNAKQLIALVEDVLDLSKIESGVVALECTLFDLVEMLYNISMRLKLLVREGVEIVTEFPDEELYIVADRPRLKQLIKNFVTNAIKFTQNGSVTLGYELFEEKRIRLYVRDTGIGISEDNCSIVFDRFEKIGTYMQGAGLGLSIAKSLVKLMNGEIGVDSKLGLGSTFWAILPFVSQDDYLKATGEAVPMWNEDSENIAWEENSWDERLMDEPLMEKSLNGESLPKEPSPEKNLQLKRILVAEDNDSNSLVVFSCLKNQYDLIRARNGREALAIMKVQSVDLILMDLKMPEMNGIEATRRIREFNIEVPIIALTAYAFENDRIHAMEAGCNGILTKPIHRSILLETVHRYFEKEN